MVNVEMDLGEFKMYILDIYNFVVDMGVLFLVYKLWKCFVKLCYYKLNDVVDICFLVVCVCVCVV